MKKFTKLLGIVLIIALVMSMGTMALAADPSPTDPYSDGGSIPTPVVTPLPTEAVNTPSGSGDFTVTIVKNETDTATHAYAAYQIFAGDLYEETNGTRTLSNITWGSGIKTDSTTLATLASALNGLRNSTTPEFTTLTADSSARTFAEAISSLNATHDSDTAQAIAAALGAALSSTASGTGTNTNVSGLNAGYYLIKDASNPTGDNGAQSRFMLQVLADVRVYEKASVPSVEKKVKEKNDSVAESATNPTDWQDAADYDIGDAVPFQITATTASTVSDYTKYHVTIQDQQSAGLTAPENYTITVLGKAFYMDKSGDFYTAADFETKDTSTTAGTATTDSKTKITVEKVNPDTDFTFAIKVTFENSESTATDLKQINSEANSKPIVVTYSSVLNDNAKIGAVGNPNEVYLKYSNNPNKTDDQDEGTTPKDKVIVFTYEIKALKVQPDGSTEISAEDYGKLSEAEKANYDAKTTDAGTVYVAKTKALQGAGFTLFKKYATVSDANKNSTLKFTDAGAKVKGAVVVDSGTYWVAVQNEITGMTTFEFVGTDAGDYKLVETTVPAGFNKADDVNFTVTATYDTESQDPVLKSLTVTNSTATFTTEAKTYGEGTDAVTSNNAILSTTVLNQKGTVLPSTGGVGTTIFYVVGSILVIAAGVLLITKKRMSREG